MKVALRPIQALAPLLLLGAFALPGSAQAQDTVPGGTVVQVTAISKKDSYYKQRKEVVGLVCGVEDPGLDLQVKRGKKVWYSGAVVCGEAGEFYFYQVGVQPGDYGYSFEELTGGTLEAPPEPTAESPFPIGARVRVRDVAEDDSYYEDRAGIIGQSCTVGDAPLGDSGEGWFSGQLVACDDGRTFYFFRAQLEMVEALGTAESNAAPAVAAPAGAAPVVETSHFPAGKMVKVLDVGAADALYPTRTAIIGRTCSVIELGLVATGDGFYGGRLFCDDGKSYQGFMLKVAATP